MRVDDFDFDLPEERIALWPARPRDSARLLEVSGDKVTDHIVRDLPFRLKAGDLLVLNDTRVLPASLTAIRPARPVGGGGDVQLDINLLAQTAPDRWQAFARPAKRLKPDDVIFFGDHLQATVTDKNQGEVTLRFSKSGDALSEAIHTVGAPPLPPYIARKRELSKTDVDDYQTVYAKDSGSVAAPTAGLHFTPNLMSDLEARGVEFLNLTLHVGAGTFLPVSTADTADHKMHSEWCSLSAGAARKIMDVRRRGGRIIAVGTTSLRTLESAATSVGCIEAFEGDTDIFITPGYTFKIVDGLMTNFHLPKSTLFMLVCALAGTENMKVAYAYAIENKYRFYSYGDSSLLWRK